MSTAKASEWRAAEAVLQRYDREHGWQAGAMTIHPELEFLFRTGLVHRGRVVSGGGVPMLLRYLADVRALDGRALSAEAFEVLVETLRAGPWSGGRSPIHTWSTGQPRSIKPKLALANGWLVYDAWRHDGGGLAEGSIEVGPPRYVRFRLTVSPRYTGGWSESLWYLQPRGKLTKEPF